MSKYGIIASFLILALVPAGLIAGTVSGTVTDAESGEGLAGANVIVEGTSFGAAVDANGNYKIDGVPAGNYTVTATYVGYEPSSKDGYVSAAGDVINFVLEPSVLRGGSVFVTANRAVERETPIVFSNIGGDEIRENYITQDVPDMMKNVPGVWTTSMGLGESEVRVRGFGAEYVNIMIDGVIQNDPENGWVYWSNWTGLSGNAQDIQIQRGSGANLYGSGAFGGVVNIETAKMSPKRFMNFVLSTGGGERDLVDSTSAQYERDSFNNYIYAFDFNSGEIVGGLLNLYFRYERKAGGSWGMNTEYDGHSWYVGAQLNALGRWSLSLHGAPQSHNQLRASQDPALQDKFGRSWNRNNHPYRENYYYKPVYQLTHSLDLSANTALKTQVFLTTGDGGGRYLRNDALDGETGEDGLKSVSSSKDFQLFQRHQNYIDYMMGRDQTYHSDNADSTEMGISSDTTMTYYLTINDSMFMDVTGDTTWQSFADSILTTITEDTSYTYYVYVDTDGDGTEELVQIKSGDSKGHLIAASYDHSWKNDSQNNHVQYGFNTHLRHRFGDVLTVVGGMEYRFWDARHTAQSFNFRYYDTTQQDSIGIIDEVQRRYDYNGQVTNQTFFGRLMFKPMPRLTAMADVQLASVRYETVENPQEVYDFYSREFTGEEYFATKELTLVDGSQVFSADDYIKEYSFLQPKFGVNYNITKNLNFIFNYSIGYKEPQTHDVYDRTNGPKGTMSFQVNVDSVATFTSQDDLFDVVDNTSLGDYIGFELIDLDPEKAVNMDFGLGWRSSNFRLDLNIYNMKFTDKIESIWDRDEKQTLNAGSATMRGVELGWSAKLSRDLLFSGSVTAQDHRWDEMDVDEIFGVSAEEIAGSIVPGSPQQVSNFELKYLLSDNMFASLSNNQWSGYFVDYENTYELPTFNETNVKIGYVMDMGGTKVSAILHANNIFSHEHYVQGSQGKDYGYYQGFQNFIATAPVANYWLTLKVSL